MSRTAACEGHSATEGAEGCGAHVPGATISKQESGQPRAWTVPKSGLCCPKHPS